MLISLKKSNYLINEEAIWESFGGRISGNFLLGQRKLCTFTNHIVITGTSDLISLNTDVPERKEFLYFLL